MESWQNTSGISHNAFKLGQVQAGVKGEVVVSCQVASEQNHTSLLSASTCALRVHFD